MTWVARAVDIALEEGFDRAAVDTLDPAPDAGRFEAWLEAGHAASMSYLERFRDRIADPQLTAPGAGSMLVVALGCARPEGRLADRARIARYALSRDYHRILDGMLRAVGRRLEAEDVARPVRVIVDAGPVLERSHAARVGLGFPSKAANLLDPEWGPWMLLGELFLDRAPDAVPDAPTFPTCGTCTACLDACPTGALVEPGVLDSGRCLSYLNIEHRGPIEDRWKELMGEWLFGCDVCSEVCPHGFKAMDRAEQLGTCEAARVPGALEWLTMAEEEWDRATRGSAMRRAGHAGIRRNAAIVLGHLGGGRPEVRAALEQSCGDTDEGVADASRWSLARLERKHR